MWCATLALSAECSTTADSPLATSLCDASGKLSGRIGSIGLLTLFALREAISTLRWYSVLEFERLRWGEDGVDCRRHMSFLTLFTHIYVTITSRRDSIYACLASGGLRRINESVPFPTKLANKRGEAAFSLVYKGNVMSIQWILNGLSSSQ